MHARQSPLPPSTPKSPLKLGSIPQPFRLPRGQVLACTSGCLWITSDALAGLRDSDVVLERGQSFVTPQAATYFVGAPRGCGVLDFATAPQCTETTC